MLMCMYGGSAEHVIHVVEIGNNTLQTTHEQTTEGLSCFIVHLKIFPDFESEISRSAFHFFSIG